MSMRGATARGGKLGAALVLALALLGCARGCPSSRPPIHVNPNMDWQPRYDPQSESDFFYDGATMRTPVPGTVARGQLRTDPTFFTGRDAGGGFLAAMPVEPSEALLARGAERYAIFCQPCHDKRGTGKGILYERGGVPTASFHDERVKNLPDGEIFDVITIGKGMMAGYAYPIPPADRWAIIAHVRRLQRERETGGAAAAAR
jgi:hypothetical protein